MAFTNTWDETFPADAQLAKLGAQDMRTIQTNVRERISAFAAGLAANRPTPEASFVGVTYLSTDTNKLERWNGATWDDITSVIQAMVTSPLVSSDGARVRRSTNQPILHSTWTPISFSSARYDSNSLFDISQPTRLTCKTAGKYLITGEVQFSTNVTGIRQAGFQPNGGLLGANLIAVNAYVSSPINAPIIGVSTVYQLVIGDYVQFIVHQTSGITLDILSVPSYTPELSIQFLSL